MTSERNIIAQLRREGYQDEEILDTLRDMKSLNILKRVPKINRAPETRLSSDYQRVLLRYNSE